MRNFKNSTIFLKKFSVITLSIILLGGLYPQQTVFADSISFGSEINLSNNGSDSKTPEIFVSGSNVYVVWRDGNNIFFSKSNNGGSSFSSVIDIGDTGSSSLNGIPKVSVSGNNVYVIWKQDNDIKFINSTNNGVSFSSAEVQLSSNSNTSKSPIISSSGSTVLTAWHEQISGANDEIIFKRSANSGENFDSAIKVGETNAVFPHPQITTTASNVYVIWQNSTDIVFARSTNSGASFNSEISIGGSTGQFQNSSPQIAASGTNVYAIWQEGSDIKFSTSTDSGQNFSTPIDIGNTGGSNVPALPQLAVISSNIFAVWRDDSTGSGDIIFKLSTDNGASFNFPSTPSDGNISNNSGVSSNPKIAASGTNVHISWEDTTLSVNGDVFHKISTSSGDTFGSLQNVSNDSELSAEHNLAISGSSPFIVWKDDNIGDVLFRTGTLSSINISFDKTQYKIGDTATITITGASGPIIATIQSDTDPSGISINLVEGIPGTFSGSFTFTESGSSSGTKLRVSPSDQITASFSGSSSSASIFSRTIEYDGGFTTFDLGNIAHVKVTDQNSNTNPSTVQQIFVKVASGTDPIGITLQLAETGPNTGIFGGSTGTTQSDLIFMLGNDLQGVPSTITIEQEETTADTTSNKDQLTVGVSSTSDPSPGGITLTLTETGNSTGVFTGTLNLINGPSVPGTSIKVTPGDFLKITRGTLSSYTMIIPNPNLQNGAIQVSLTPLSGDFVLTTFKGSFVNATVFDANAPGGGGGGLVRPGLVVNILAGAGLFGTGSSDSSPPAASLGEFISSKNFDVPDEIRTIVENHNSLVPIKPMDPNMFEGFDFPLTINYNPYNGYPLGGYENTLETNYIKVGTPITLTFTFYEQTEIQHFSFYTNLYGTLSEIYQSDTQFIYNKDQPIKIIDPHELFSDVNITINELNGTKKKVILEFTPNKPTEVNDFVVRAWDPKLHSMDMIVREAYQIITNEEPLFEENIPEPEIEQLQSTYVPIWIKNNAAWWSQELIDDSDFVAGIEYLIQNKIITIQNNQVIHNNSQQIPEWIKNNASWWSENLITEKEFIDGLQWLISNGIIQVIQT